MTTRTNTYLRSMPWPNAGPLFWKRSMDTDPTWSGSGCPLPTRTLECLRPPAFRFSFHCQLQLERRVTLDATRTQGLGSQSGHYITLLRNSLSVLYTDTRCSCSSASRLPHIGQEARRSGYRRYSRRHPLNQSHQVGRQPLRNLSDRRRHRSHSCGWRCYKHERSMCKCPERRISSTARATDTVRLIRNRWE